MSDGLGTEQPLWRPNPEQIAASNLTRFTQQVQAAIGRELPTYAVLHRWSIDAPDVFWSEVWRFTDVLASERAVHPVQDLDRFPGARWFEGAKLNYAENLLRFRDDKPALIS
ncbi:MAG: acetyl-coenzyme A synthetase N-terminal domain-containing protein, partial [Pseudomonadales bacterium]